VPHDEPGSFLRPELTEQSGDVLGFGQADSENKRVRRQQLFVDRVVDDDAADLGSVVAETDLSMDELQQGRAQVVEDAPEAGTGSSGHRRNTT
jgi:hypothetical protein